MSSNSPTESISTLSDGQEITLSVLTVIACILSAIGSGTIAYKVIRNRKNATSYDRLLLGLSVSDIIASPGYGLSPFLLPRKTSPRLLAVGNDATCNLLGFLTQMAFAPSFYNGALSIYFLCTIRFAMQRQHFADHIEPWMHFSIWLFVLPTSLSGWILGFYAELSVTMACWVKEYPRGCEATNSCISHYIAWAFGGIPIFFALLTLVINNLIIYKYVRGTLGVSLFRDKRQELEQIYTRRQLYVREVAIQGLLYVVSWFMAFTASIVIRIGESQLLITPADEKRIFWLLLADSFFRPLQGFANMIVYNRLDYNRFRAVYPNRPKWWAVRRACLDPHTPRLSAAPDSQHPNTNPSRFCYVNDSREQNQRPHRSTFGIGSVVRSSLAKLFKSVHKEDDFKIESSHHSSSERQLQHTQPEHLEKTRESAYTHHTEKKRKKGGKKAKAKKLKKSNSKRRLRDNPQDQEEQAKPHFEVDKEDDKSIDEDDDGNQETKDEKKSPRSSKKLRKSNSKRSNLQHADVEDLIEESKSVVANGSPKKKGKKKTQVKKSKKTREPQLEVPDDLLQMQVVDDLEQSHRSNKQRRNDGDKSPTKKAKNKTRSTSPTELAL